VGEVIIGGTNPIAAIGSAILNDGPFGLGLVMTVDPSILPRGHVMTVTMQFGRNGTVEGSVLFASAVVPQSSASTVFSGYYVLPQWGLNSTLGYDLWFLLNDNGLVSAPLFQQQWTQAISPTKFLAFFPGKNSTV
jgi:hypothetical protein